MQLDDQWWMRLFQATAAAVDHVPYSAAPEYPVPHAAAFRAAAEPLITSLLAECRAKVDARVQAAGDRQAAETLRHVAETAPVVRYDNGYPVKAVPVSDLLSFAAALEQPTPGDRS
jgi:hypothetical protein